MFGSKRGIPAKDLRPFSVEDPHGHGLASPAEERLKRRIRREGSRASVQTAQAVLREAKRHAAPPRAARPPQAEGSQSSRSDKKKLGGCLPVLIVLGLLYGAGTLIIPPVWNLVEQQIILHTGGSGVAQVASLESSNFSIGDDTVYVVVLRVVPEIGDPYMVTVSQPFSSVEAQKLQPESWVQIRIKGDDPLKVAVSRVAIDDPTVARLPPDRVVDRPSDHGDRQEHPSADHLGDANESGTDQLDPRRSGDVGSAALDPEADRTAPEESNEGIALICLQARACCKIAGGSTCEPFANPAVPVEACQRALQGFSRLATAIGKSCAGAP